MLSRKNIFHDIRSGTAIICRVFMGAPRTEITEILPDGTILVELIAPTYDKETNKALISLLTKILGITEAQIEIIGNDDSKDKILTIMGLNSEKVFKQISDHIKN